MNNGWEYEPDDRSVGITGGWYHADCPAEDTAIPEETVVTTEYRGSGWGREIVVTLALSCPACKANATVVQVDWDPEDTEAEVG